VARCGECEGDGRGERLGALLVEALGWWSNDRMQTMTIATMLRRSGGWLVLPGDLPRSFCNRAQPDGGSAEEAFQGGGREGLASALGLT
jgi:hypothetical protein